MKTVLVLGATGQVGSQVVKILATKGYRVKAVVRSANAKIYDTNANVEYCLGDLAKPELMRNYLEDVDVVVATANTAVPVKTISTAEMYAIGYKKFINLCEEMRVGQFIFCSAPTHKLEHHIPELYGKRTVEALLINSTLKYSIVRNPIFMDVWLVITGCCQMEYPDPHATTKRPFRFLRFWKWMVGNFVVGYGLMFAPGGAQHGVTFISAQDVATMLAGCVDNTWAYNRIIEGGGPEYITWRQVADLYEEHLQRKIRIIPMPLFIVTVFQKLIMPFSIPASETLGFIKFVAKWQAFWNSSPIVANLKLPKQITVAEYIAARFSEMKEVA